MTTDPLSLLAERCEGAAGPDRELDADILACVDPAAFERLRIEAGMPSGAPDAMMTAGAREYVKYRSCYWFSSSLDSAMALAPEGWEYSIMNGNGYHEATFTSHKLERTAWGTGGSMALAVCASALRARSRIALDQGNGDVG